MKGDGQVLGCARDLFGQLFDTAAEQFGGFVDLLARALRCKAVDGIGQLRGKSGEHLAFGDVVQRLCCLQKDITCLGDNCCGFCATFFAAFVQGLRQFVLHFGHRLTAAFFKGRGAEFFKIDLGRWWCGFEIGRIGLCGFSRFCRLGHKPVVNGRKNGFFRRFRCRAKACVVDAGIGGSLAEAVVFLTFGLRRQRRAGFEPAFCFADQA